MTIKGLGACLLQDKRPVYFASKALTEVQRGYVAIELESLAVAWAMEKFHHFLYANHYILEADQKPLETILSRSLNQTTPHLQRILIRTFAYNFTVRYLPGLKNQSIWTFREEQKILILKGTRIVIPSKKQDAILNLIHEGHLGLTKCKLHAKETVYWPGLNKQLEKLILHCPLCLKYFQSKCKQPSHMSLEQEIPIHPLGKTGH